MADCYSLGATRFTVAVVTGATAPALIKVPAGSNGGFFKILSGGGTLEILPATIAGGSIGGATTNVLATGYPVGGTEIVSFSGPASFYLAATGAAMVVGLTFTYSQGGQVV